MSSSYRMEPFKFQSPTSIGIFAPSYSGKTTLSKKILENSDKLFTSPPSFVVYCYNEWLDIFDQLSTIVKNLILFQGVPGKEDIDKWANGKHFIIVLDDLQQVCEKNKEVANMFTVGSHHKNFTLIYSCHNIFGKGVFARTINLNTHYLILFHNNRDTQQVQTLGCQIFGKKSAYFMDAYKKATSVDWSYLLVNLHQRTTGEEQQKLLTNILPGETTVIYLPLNKN